MRVVLTGANGLIGSMIVREMIEAGHSVVGLVRDKEKVALLTSAGAVPMISSIEDLDPLRRAAGDVEGVIHTAFGLDMIKIP